MGNPVSKFNKVIFYTLFLFIPSTILAQNNAFSTPSDWEKKYTVVKQDSSANAVVLYEKGDVYFEVIDNRILMVKKVRKKVKILNKNGKDYATVEIPLYFDFESSEKVQDLKAVTHNGDKKQWVSQDQIFNVQKDSNFKEIRFTFPDVQEGSILEYAYTLISPFYFKLDGWTFQSNIPKVYSEFNVRIPRNYSYNRSLLGNLTLDINDSYIESNCFVLPKPWDASDCEFATYAMKNVPAFQEEEYMLSPKNFISRIEFELSEYFTLDRVRKKYTKTWKDVDKDFSRNDNFGGQVSNRSFFKNNLPNELLAEKDPLSKAKQVYNFVQKHFVWDGTFSIHRDIDVKSAFGSKKGSVGEINVALTNFLNAADIQAEPVLLSTRNNGLPKKDHPVIYDFNYLITKISIGGNEYLLDATDKLNPFGMLPFRCLNYYGRVMDFKKGSYWHDITPEKKNSKIIRVQMKMDAENESISGIFDEINLGYFAVEKRRDLLKFSDEAYLDLLQERLGDDILITSHKLFKERSHDKMVSERCGFEMEDTLDGDTIYINPFITSFFQTNPFKLGERSYPIDFGYSRVYSYQVNLDIPANYKVVSLPDKVNQLVEGNLAKLKFDYQVVQNKIVASLNLTFNSSFFDQNNYESIKDLIRKSIEVQKNSYVVLEKI